MICSKCKVEMFCLDEQTEFCKNPRCSEYLKNATDVTGFRQCSCGNELFEVIGGVAQTEKKEVVCDICGQVTRTGG